MVRRPVGSAARLPKAHTSKMPRGFQSWLRKPRSWVKSGDGDKVFRQRPRRRRSGQAPVSGPAADLTSRFRGSKGYRRHRLPFKSEPSGASSGHIVGERRPQDSVELLSLVSEPLRVQLHFEQYLPVIEKHPFFKRYSKERLGRVRPGRQPLGGRALWGKDWV